MIAALRDETCSHTGVYFLKQPVSVHKIKEQTLSTEAVLVLSTRISPMTGAIREIYWFLTPLRYYANSE
jgi:hypothetical protein